MASKSKSAPAKAIAPHADAPAHDARDDMIYRLQQQLEATSNRLAALEQVASGELLPPEETPIFEIGPGGYYSADDQLYPEGTIVEDITGRMPLNEQMIPHNEPAQIRLEHYLASLPQHGTPSHEFVLEAAFRRLGDLSGNPEDRAKFFAGVLEEAAHLRMTQLGLSPGQPMPRAASPRTAAQRAAVPMMPNTRIRHDASPLGALPPGPLTRSGPATTRVRAPAAAPANKAAPPMGGVPTTNLGTASPGARAA